MTPFDIVIIIAVGCCWARLVRPGSRKLAGETVAVSHVPLLGRLRMHAITGGLTLAGALALAGAGFASWWPVLLALGSAVALVATPVRYTLTDSGIRLGWTSFRRWTEFAGVRRSRGGAILVGVRGSRRMRIWLSRSRGDDEFLQLLRQMVKGAYKGHAVVIPFPLRTNSRVEQTDQAPAGTDG